MQYGDTSSQTRYGQPKSGAVVTPGTDSKGNKGEWHIYPDGRRVFVAAKATTQSKPTGQSSFVGAPTTFDAPTATNKPPATSTPLAAPPAPERPLPSVYGEGDWTTGAAGILAAIQRAQADSALAGSRDSEDLSTFLQRLARAQAQATQGINEASNKQGLWYSGTRAKRLSDSDQGFGDQSADATLSKQRRDEDRARALAAMGNVVADPTAPGGYRATGGAAQSFAELYNTVRNRLVARDAGVYA